MMIRLIHTLGVLALAAAAVVGVLCARPFLSPSREFSGILAAPSALARFNESVGPLRDREERVPPLVAQAQTLALYLDPPPPPGPPRPMAKKPVAPEPPPPPRPAQTSPKFKVLSTSCSETNRARSIALIAVPGADAQWMREGEQVGHVVIHEIRPGTVVCLAGEQLCELSVETEVASPSLAGAGGSALSSAPRSAASAVPAGHSTGPSRRPTRRSSRTVGSNRNRILD